MTPDQAIQILDQIVSSVAMDRQGHFRAQEAIRTLQALRTPENASNGKLDPSAKRKKITSENT